MHETTHETMNKSARGTTRESVNGAVNLVVAHRPEAAPLLDWFDLTESRPRGRFRCYQGGDGIALTISGTGAHNAAAAVRHLHERQPEAHRAWLNVGIAGHRGEPLGTGLLINRIEHRRSGERHWPPVPRLGLPGSSLVSVDKPETEYPEDAAYDMEAAGFFAEASRLIASDLVYVFKIVSDNRASPLAELDLRRVPELIRLREREIRAIVEHLRQRCARFASCHTMPDEYPLLLGKCHFSATRKAMLAGLCRRGRALGMQQRLHTLAKQRFRDAGALLQAAEAALAAPAQAREAATGETGEGPR